MAKFGTRTWTSRQKGRNTMFLYTKCGVWRDIRRDDPARFSARTWKITHLQRKSIFQTFIFGLNILIFSMCFFFQQKTERFWGLFVSPPRCQDAECILGGESWIMLMSFQTGVYLGWLGGGWKNIFDFHPETWGRWTHFDSCFSDALKPPTRWFRKNPGDYDWLASELPPKNTKFPNPGSFIGNSDRFIFAFTTQRVAFFKWFGVYSCFCLRFFISLSLKHVPLKNLLFPKGQ